MAELPLNGATIRYEVSGPRQAPALLLLNSLGTDCTMWTAQLHSFAEHFRVVRFDTRGQGASTVTPGPYSIAQLAEDVIGLLDALELEQVAVCGLSMGGLIAQHLAIFAPNRIGRVVLCCTAACIGTEESWNSRIAAVEAAGGLGPLVPAILERWYTDDFRARNCTKVERTAAMLRANDAHGYVANCVAIRDADYRSSLALIRSPTLVLCGSSDSVTPPRDAAFLAAEIPEAALETLDAAHLANVEQPHAFSAAALDFLRGERTHHGRQRTLSARA